MSFSKHIESQIQRATQFADSGDFLAAEELAIQCLKKRPGFNPAFSLLHRVCLENGQIDEAKAFQVFRKPEFHRIPPSFRKRYFDGWQEGVCMSAAKSNSVEEILVAASEKNDLEQPSLPLVNYSRLFTLNTVESDDAILYRVPEGRIWFDGFNQVVWDKRGNIMQELCRGHAELVDYHVRERSPKKIKGSLLQIANRNCRNYYHWMSDILPSLMVAERAGYCVKKIDYILSNTIELGFQKETLGRFGVENTKILEHDSDSYLESDELLVPMFGGNSLGLKNGSWISDDLRKVFADTDNSPGHDRYKRVYIKRGETDSRQVVGESALIDMLERDYGFHTLEPGKLTVQEQMAHFSSADLIVAAHGAALTNIHFCKPQTTVVELYDQYIDPCFWFVCNRNSLSHNHYWASNDEIDNPAEHYKRINLGKRRKAAINIDAHDFGKHLSLIIP